ncbi:MAG: MATE family efflux transporter [Clostridia bacterium]|nr:MATE family efflux transporter [Clostridia bacterium]
MIREKQFYRSFFAMCLLLVAQNVITLSVNLADNLMLGAFSEKALSGAAAANQIQFVYQQILIAFGETAVILGSQYFGRKQYEPIRRLFSVALRFGAGASLLLFAAVSLFPERLIGIFTKDQAIIAEGVSYLSVIRYTYLVFAVSQILLATLRATGVANIALMLSVLSLGINVGGNWLLIYGNLGFPAMGIKGAAVATLISRLAEIGVLLYYAIRRERHLRLTPRDLLRGPGNLLPDYVRVMLPVLVNAAMWGFNTAAQNAILGNLDARAIAANSVASTLFLLVKSAAVGASSTASFFIGRKIGEGSMSEVKRCARTLQVLFVMIGAAAALVLFLLRGSILSLYNLEAETRAMASAFLGILTAVMLPMSYQMPTNSGIIKGGGGTKYFMILDFVSIWLIVIPVSWYAAFRLHAAPSTVLWLLNADQFFKCVPAFLMCNFGRWAHRLTRDA